MGDSVDSLVASSQRPEPGSINVKACGWPQSAKDTAADPAQVAKHVVQVFNAALDKGDNHAISQLFVPDAYWRDHLALSWDFRTLKGQAEIKAGLEQKCPIAQLHVDATSEWRKPKMTPLSPTQEVLGIQFYIKVRMSDGHGRGVARLVQTEDESWKVWTLYTSRETIEGHDELVGPRRDTGVQHGDIHGRQNWLDRRKTELDFSDKSPHVLIIGAGQAGLTAHARLKVLNVSCLIIDQNHEIGDNWRKRYHQLVLHDPVWYNHLPYVDFPATWPIFTPKDKLASWLQCYAETLELNVWMRSTITSSTWDDDKSEWTVTVQRSFPDGRSEVRTLRPKHVIQATGHAGKMHFPPIPGRESFKGPLLHSSQFPGAKPNGQGKKAVVIGACNSSHDICQDYWENGWHVTMIQRSSTCVVTSASAMAILLGGVYEEGGPPTEDADLWLWSWPIEAFKKLHQDVEKIQRAADAPILEALTKAGFKLDYGPDEAGLFIKYLQRGGGYYFDVGASHLIADGNIKLKQGVDVSDILPNGVKLADGTVLEADELIFATGYDNMRTQTRAIFGDAVADRMGDIWGYGEDGEMRTIWRASGHPGMWIHGGNLAMSRYFSRLLALQIKAKLLALE